MADGNTTDDVINNEQNGSTGASRAAGKGKDKAAEKAKKAMKKAKEARKKGKYAKGIGKILWPILAVVIIVVMIIGFISVAMNMPGSVVDSIIGFGEKITTTLKNWANETDISGTITEQDKLDALNYLQQMGYDVVGMGFVSQIAPENADGNENPITWFEENEYGPSYLFAYIFANERMYIQKNQTFGGKIKELFSISTGSGNTWGEGMLNFYGDESVVDGNELDRENLTLTFKNMHGFFKTDVYQYNIDGWAGRYGTPLELLLAIHASTMMPDLAYELVSNENLQTVVNINAQEVALELSLKLIGPDGEADLNLGTAEDEPIPIEFYRDQKTGDFGINNKDQIINGLKDGTYTVAALKEAFWQFENNLYDFSQTPVANATQGVIEELVSTDSNLIYKINGDTSMLTTFGKYLGTVKDVEEAYRNGTTLYNGTISIDDMGNDGSVTLTCNGTQYTVQVYTVSGLTSFETALRDGTKITDDDEQYEMFSQYWKDLCVKLQYATIFQEIDVYMYNLIRVKSVNAEELNYKGNEDNTCWYQQRFDDWVDTLQAPLTFNEYIEQNGLQDAISYEKDGKYKNYIKNWAAEQVVGLNEILEQIKQDIGVQQDTAAAAQNLKNDLSREIGLTAEQVDIIYDEFLVKEPEITTFVPQIKSVVKHWYKDLVFQYKNAAKGTVFQTEYPGEGIEGYTLYYEFKTLDGNYPVQDGEPYVIKGDIVTQDGEKVDKSDIPVDDQTKEVLGEDYTLGTGYKTARKLFTQGYYYQYDGTEETAKEIEFAKKMESYSKGTSLKVIVKNSRIVFVEPSTEEEIGYERHRFADKDNNDVENQKDATYVWDTYFIAAPGSYVSAADGDSKQSAEDINAVLKKIGTGIRRKKVSMSSNTTSLTALSMLEGMHSLDADYIYREFKEFLIELGYYSRAEIESVETNVLDWFIPGFTPEQWPPVKSEEQMGEYGTELLASANIKDTTTLSVEKMTNLDNFIFYTDTSGVIDATTLATAGTNIQCITGELKANDIVDKIINNNPAAICIYANFNAKDDENAVVKTKQLIQDIRTKLTEANYKSPDIAIFVLQLLPLEQPNLLAEESREIVDQNKRISNYNTSLYNVCLNQDNVKFVDATSGCVTDNGWLSTKFDSSKLSQNIISKIVKKNVSNGGFEEGLEVITPGAGYITAITEKEITIEFSVEQDPALRSIDGFSMVISGISVDEELRNKFASEAITDEEGNVKLPIEKSSVIGITIAENIKLIMRDKNKAILGNIEDYMDLPNNKNGQEISEWELLYFLPKESGPIDADGCGTESVGGVGSSEVAAGIIQWTTNSDYNNVSVLCSKLVEKDPDLCGGLQAFTSWDSSTVMADIGSGSSSQIKQAFSSITDKDKEGFLALQVECMKEQYGVPPSGTEWILERRGVVYGTYISAKVWAGVNCGVEDAINSNMSDEQLVSAILKKARQSKGNDPSFNAGWDNRVDPNYSGSQMSIALGIINGDYTEEEIEDLVRNGY